MNKYSTCLLLFLSIQLLGQSIPLPEHPRPDFHRHLWQNLNGVWDFEFDKADEGIKKLWFEKGSKYTKKITVPFPWGSPLSGVGDEADIAWYRKQITIPSSWDGKKTFIIIGASDWATDVWVDGKHLGRHEGGYMPFEFELEASLQDGKSHDLVIRADDKRRMFTLYGKQGYGNARGIWQTVYMEARGDNFVTKGHFTPDIDKSTVKLDVALDRAPEKETSFSVIIENGDRDIAYSGTIAPGKTRGQAVIPIPNAKWWSLENPHLYDAKIIVSNDTLHTYFGMRKISVENLPGTDIPYISLNGKPVYLQLALDQAYHPDGFYTFPTDEFMKAEVSMAKEIGLNGIRIHIKPEMPRKLYWADKLGVLVMADLPNSWGEPDEDMQRESEMTLRAMIDRDYNHPAIFSWIVFNETWGLVTKVKEDGKEQNKYLPSTQNWVASMYYLTKSLDPSRLVEDNSICCGRGHTETDIMSWHEYLPGWEWEEHLTKITTNLRPGNDYLFEKGFAQGRQPNINSECGNVWGYEGSTGDVDWSYDYHRMLNSFRKFPQVAGWLYTEHHDVINEWNGYWRFDRSKKYTGFEEIHPGMTLADLHGKYYVSMGNEVTLGVQADEQVSIPLFLSVFDDAFAGGKMVLEYEVIHTDRAAMQSKFFEGKLDFTGKAWHQGNIGQINFSTPKSSGLSLLRITLKDENGKVLHRNFMHLVVENGSEAADKHITTTSVHAYIDAQWTLKKWEVLDGIKVNGAGKGYFEYEIEAPTLPKGQKFVNSYIVFEAGAKQLFDKDKSEGFDQNQDYMLGSRVSPSLNPNAYPMTDETLFPSKIKVSIDGQQALVANLKDDAADHRGVLSWHNQLKDKKLREAGSYGELIKVPVKKSIWSKKKKIKLRIETVGEGGLALYGKDFGQYPLDINWVLESK